MEKTSDKFYFTAGKLIEILKIFPEDMPVRVSGYENGFENFYQPEILKLKHEPENPYFEGEFQPVNEGDKEIFEAIVLERVVRDD